MLNLLVKEKNIEIQEPLITVIRGTVGEKISIVFDEFWRYYNKTIVFKRFDNYYTLPIAITVFDMKVEIEIPWEIVAESGTFKIGAYGTTQTETLPTLWSEEIKIEYGTDTYGEAPKPPTPNVYDELLVVSQKAVDIANSVRKDADNGEFNGDKGEKGDKGDKGDDYVLTETDKADIANIVLAEFVDGDGVDY